MFISAPSMIPNITFEVEKSSVFLKWDRPLQSNGILSLYYIEYSDVEGNIRTINTTKLQTNITDLASYTNYTFKVRKCIINLGFH